MLPSSRFGLRTAALVALATAGLVLACADARDRDGADDGASAVVGGQHDTRYPAVGYLRMSGATCTGTLIGPKLVLTAAHCTKGRANARFGWGDASANDTVAVRATVNHPRYRAPRANEGFGVQSFDIALLELETAPPITPMPTGPTPRSGRVLGLGYGSNAHGRDDAGVYRGTGSLEERKSIEGVILAQNPVEVYARFDGTGQTCYGDSGGPLIADGKVVGTLSRFVGVPSCRPESRTPMAYTRVEGMEAFFDAAKACFASDDPDACARAESRGLCAPARTPSMPIPVRPTSGDAREGAYMFTLSSTRRALRLPAFTGKVVLSIHSDGDALADVTRGSSDVLGRDVSEIEVEPGATHDVLVKSCNGESQYVTIVWNAAE